MIMKKDNGVKNLVSGDLSKRPNKGCYGTFIRKRKNVKNMTCMKLKMYHAGFLIVNIIEIANYVN